MVYQKTGKARIYFLQLSSDVLSDGAPEMKIIPDTIVFQPSPGVRAFLRKRARELRLPASVPACLDFLINHTLKIAHLKSQAEKFINMKYLLLDQNHQPKSCTLEQWAAWQKNDPDLSVEYSVVGDSAIGTRFISILPHEGAPCWETNVVGGKMHGKREVCAGNRDQAEQMHASIVDLVRKETEHQ